MAENARFNIHTSTFDYDDSDPEGYRAGMCRFGPRIGASKLGASIYELPPGQSICPFHYEWGEEEWLLGLEGTATLRTSDGEEEVGPGDVVCFPEGPAGAHKISNRGGETIRVMMFSTRSSVAVSVYPDSDKVGAFVLDGGSDSVLLFRRADAVQYYEDESHSR